MSRIVHVITRFINGGAEENTLLTCNHQAATGHAVWLVYGAEYRPRMLQQLDRRVIPVRLSSLVRPVSPARDLAALWRMAWLLSAIGPDVIHTHTSKAGIIGRLASLVTPSARVVHGVHILPFGDAPDEGRSPFVLLERLAALRTHAFIHVSAHLRDCCLKRGVGRPDEHFVVASGMDIGRFRAAEPAPDMRALREAAGEGAVIAGYLSVFEPRKRHRQLIECLAPALLRRPGLHVALAGDGPDRAMLEETVAALGLAKQVHFVGFRNDPDRFIAGCDLCLFASALEGLPRVVVQYAAVGRPILATRLPGIDLVVEDGRNGHVVDDFDHFARCFEALADDAATRRAMADESAGLDLWDWDAAKMVRRIDEIYERTMPAPAAAAASLQSAPESR